jgi:hypothetical protein
MGRIIRTLVSDENLLQLACYAAGNLDEKHWLREYADSLIVGYIMEEFEGKGQDEFTEEEIQERYAQLLTEFILEDMSKDGLIDAIFDDDGTIKYTLTDEGKDFANQTIEKVNKDDKKN